jgi:hypothetical protein
VQKRKTHRVDNNIAEINQVWIKPPAGMLKCNVDKACYADQNIELECVCVTIKDALLHLRDDQGRFVTAYAKRLEGKPVIAEAGEIFKV